jgi:hypothetical protein
LCCGNQQADQAIDASSWIIPTDDLDYDIAIGGLLSLQQRRLPPETIAKEPVPSASGESPLRVLAASGKRNLMVCSP